MASIELLAYADAEPLSTLATPSTGVGIFTGESTPVDCSALSDLRLTQRASFNAALLPDATIYYESGPTATGPWHVDRVVRMRSGRPHVPVDQPWLDEEAWLSERRITLGAVDAFVRMRWSVEFRNWSDPKEFSLGCSGTAVQSAA